MVGRRFDSSNDIIWRWNWLLKSDMCSFWQYHAWLKDHDMVILVLFDMIQLVDKTGPVYYYQIIIKLVLLFFIIKLILLGMIQLLQLVMIKSILFIMIKMLCYNKTDDV